MLVGTGVSDSHQVACGLHTAARGRLHNLTGTAHNHERQVHRSSMGRGNGPLPACTKGTGGTGLKVMCASNNAAADMLVQQPSQQCLLLQIKESAAEARPKGHPTGPMHDVGRHNRQQQQQQHTLVCTAGHTQLDTNTNTPAAACATRTHHTQPPVVASSHACTQLAQPAHHHSNTPTSHSHTTQARDSLPSCRCTRGQHASATPHAHAASCSSSGGRSNCNATACNHAPARCTPTCASAANILLWRPCRVRGQSRHPAAASNRMCWEQLPAVQAD